VGSVILLKISFCLPYRDILARKNKVGLLTALKVPVVTPVTGILDNDNDCDATAADGC
jgi:hypothetical protein